jgi:hypothetical protein
LVYITGDLHGELCRFDDSQIRKLKKGDSLIVCGDFGFIWDGGTQEEKILKKLGKKKYNILFIDGTHENFNLLEKYPVTEWNGGKVQNISGNLYHLMRGQIFELEGKKIFTFGGGASPDKAMRIDAGKWWEHEMPSIDEMHEGVDNLYKNNLTVDYIITHEPSPRVRALQNNSTLDKTQIEVYFEEIAKMVTYEKWFFGSLHIDRVITAKHFALFNNVVAANQSDIGKRK